MFVICIVQIKENSVKQTYIFWLLVSKTVTKCCTRWLFILICILFLYAD